MNQSCILLQLMKTESIDERYYTFIYIKLYQTTAHYYNDIKGDLILSGNDNAINYQ